MAIGERKFHHFHHFYRALWTVFLVIIALISLIEIVFIVTTYLSYPSRTEVVMVTREQAPFPSVTVCNVNRLRRSAVANSQYEQLLSLDSLGSISHLMPYMGPCLSGDFECGGECVKWYMQCNGVEECRNGEDEINCASDTVIPYGGSRLNCDGGDAVFACDNSECVSSVQQCDYFDNCGDGSDERNCTYYDQDCGSDGVTCFESDTSYCVPADLVCDRIKHCRTNGEDENNCDYPDIGSNDLFSANWEDSYLHLTDSDDFYEDFRENIYREPVYGDDGKLSLINTLLLSRSSRVNDVIEQTVKFNTEELKTLGHQFEDMLIKCQYNGGKCGHSDFTVFQDNKLGNCFTFNSPSPVNVAGTQNGLKLTLSLEQDEYLGLFTSGEVGVKVLIHDPDVKPSPETDWFYARSGVSTSKEIKRVEIKRLSEPFGRCSAEYSSVNECREKCLRYEMLEYCGCTDSLIANETAPCDVTDIRQDLCLQLLRHIHRTGVVTCDCPLPCSETKYKVEMTSEATWPSSPYVPHLLEELRYSNVTSQVLNDETAIRRNLLLLETYYGSMDSENVASFPEYTMQKLMKDIGVSIAIYLSLFMIIALLVYVCCGPKCDTQKKKDVEITSKKNSIDATTNF
ncbi:uncharacterized protein LOC100371123 [Saccoglossus kowalevskii]|uniref:Degenerin-like protein unc-105-like n=1 Tax=Saccoglossus kowalevskii TaxID=10224 RepID=A0ABM0GUK1_SACKO|nr:PREDICTED: degenerin-like protein unc-105-like [Saccoglossus kowalevskii]